MKANQLWLKKITKLGLLLMMGVSISAEAGLFGFGGDSWKEEVLLHDGSKIIVKRSQSYGGRHEIGQSPPVKEQEITFTIPNTDKAVTFKSEYGEDVGRANFQLLALHVLGNTPYIIAVPNPCLSYNKWGRPNPPYVIFKYGNKEWKRITLQELPTEFKEINLVIDTKGEAKNLKAQPIVTAELIRKLNSVLEQPEYKTILREAIQNAGGRCGEMVYDGNGGWIGIGWFEDKPSKEACHKYCEQRGIGKQYCPCETLFKEK
jgi:hypothetical protein